MKMCFKAVISVLVLSAFGTVISAQSPVYNFSAFGGGLPSSATLMAASESPSPDLSDSSTDELDKELNDYLGKKQKEKMDPKKKAIIITASVAGGILVIGGIVLGGYLLKQQMTKCAESATQECAESLGDSITQSCQNGSLTDAFVSGGILSLTKGLIYVP